MRTFISLRIMTLFLALALCLPLKAQKLSLGEVNAIQIDSIALHKVSVETNIDSVEPVSQNNIVFPSLFELVDSAKAKSRAIPPR